MSKSKETRPLAPRAWKRFGKAPAAKAAPLIRGYATKLRYEALEEVAGAADGDARRFGGFHSSWRQQVADELRITRSKDKAEAQPSVPDT